MQLELITIQELLRDPEYREYFKKVPKLPPHIMRAGKPWKLMVLKKGESVWRSKRFNTYADAFAGLKKMLPSLENAAINCPSVGFMPPVKNFKLKKRDRWGNVLLVTKAWQPPITDDMEPHYWCPHCRRPSVFRIAVPKSTRMGETYFTPTPEPALRCMICGASDRIVNLRDPLDAQKWDPNRPIIYHGEPIRVKKKVKHAR